MLLTFILKEREDNSFGQQIINSGIIESLLNFFLTEQFELITDPYIELFFQLTAPSSNEITLELHNKHPYPSLIRLLDHQDIEVVEDAIRSIGNILLVGSITTSSKSVHPHFLTMIQCNGINQIYQIDYKVDEKKNAKYALNKLAQNTGNLTEIMKYVDLNKINNDLRIKIEGNEKQKKSIEIQQEGDCMLLTSILSDREDNSFRQQIINSGIVESLLNFFLTQQFELITKPYIELFLKLTAPSSNEIKLELYNKHPYPSLIRLLNHQDIEVVNDAILSIYNILNSESDTTSKSAHPHFQTMIECNGINQIYQMFQRTEIKKHSKDKAAECIGYLFRNKEIPDQEMKTEIISHLKQQLNDSEYKKRKHARKVLIRLSLNSVNRTEIQKYGFMIPKKEIQLKQNEEDDDN
ncbi:MAG: hypothetical protein EZS28_030901 [Streblomastix strix]|uniref:Uncharacterized protein n=1 Tax=Streblomastix strix TaxID=222440 RepID=A0A5J4UU00_9EUKA|nr:MAG: hypothetical protein EZS28_030901 [Streblomastix strix]